jgi:hypothetical protein
MQETKLLPQILSETTETVAMATPARLISPATPVVGSTACSTRSLIATNEVMEFVAPPSSPDPELFNADDDPSATNEPEFWVCGVLAGSFVI